MLWKGHPVTVLPIFLYGSNILRKVAEPVEGISDELITLILDMFETMRQAQGIGLAATQVGRLERVLVIDVSEVEGLEHIKPFAMINPELITHEGVQMAEEGCLSLPEIRDEVQRDDRIVMRYRDTNFAGMELEAGGILARVILHEFDHLNGVLFTDHLTKEKAAAHKDALRDIQQGKIETSYPVITSAEANKKRTKR